MMRYDGLIVPGNPHHVAPSCQDPRNKVRKICFVKSLKFSLKIHEIFVIFFSDSSSIMEENRTHGFARYDTLGRN